MFGVNSINRSVQWLVVPTPLRTDEPPCTDNILVPITYWVTIGTATNYNWLSQPRGPYGSCSVPWSGPVRAMPADVCRSPENMRSAERRVRDNLLQDNSTTSMQLISTSRSILRDCLFNSWDCN